MSPIAKKTAGRKDQIAFCAIMALIVLGAAAFVLAPRGGEPVTIVPVAGSSGIATLVSRQDTRLLARGMIDGSYVIRGERPNMLSGLIHHGVLVLNASAPGCGPVDDGPPS